VVFDIYRFEVVVTVRSKEKGQRILDAHPNTSQDELSFVIVEDIAEEGAFDEVSVAYIMQTKHLMALLLPLPSICPLYG
jgi:hypothetical protein